MKFIKHIIEVALFAIATTSIQAQTHYEANISIGCKGGATISQIFFNPKVHQKLTAGAEAGFMFRYIEENHFGVIAEANFVQRGWTENLKGTDYRYSRTLNYIEIPVLTHIYFGRRGRFFVNLGPQVAFCLGDKVNANFNPADMASLPGFPLSGRTTEEMKMDVHGKVDYGISGGIGGEFSINRRNALSLEARFYYGLGNVLKSGRTDTFRASNQMSVCVTAGYWFRVK